MTKAEEKLEESRQKTALAKDALKNSAFKMVSIEDDSSLIVLAGDDPTLTIPEFFGKKYYDMIFNEYNNTYIPAQTAYKKHLETNKGDKADRIQKYRDAYADWYYNEVFPEAYKYVKETKDDSAKVAGDKQKARQLKVENLEANLPADGDLKIIETDAMQKADFE